MFFNSGSDLTEQSGTDYAEDIRSRMMRVRTSRNLPGNNSERSIGSSMVFVPVKKTSSEKESKSNIRHSSERISFEDEVKKFMYPTTSCAASFKMEGKPFFRNYVLEATYEYLYDGPDTTQQLSELELKVQMVDDLCLSQVLSDPKKREIFREYCKDEECDHYISFLERCKQFKKIKDEKKRLVELIDISNCYLSNISENRLEVDPTLVEKVEKSIFMSQKISDNVFNEIIAEVIDKLHEMFISFKESDEALKCVLK
eukprot:gene7702-12168_t